MKKVIVYASKTNSTKECAERIQKEVEGFDLIDCVHELHKKTGFTVRLNDLNFKYFYRIYKNLDRIFQTLEMLVRECEERVVKTDFDWIILSKYNILLNVKKIMYPMQRKIHKYLDNHGNCIYALNHGNLNLNHFIQKKLISFDNGYTWENCGAPPHFSEYTFIRSRIHKSNGDILIPYQYYPVTQ